MRPGWVKPLAHVSGHRSLGLYSGPAHSPGGTRQWPSSAFLHPHSPSTWPLSRLCVSLKVYRRESRGWRFTRYGGEDVVRAKPFDAEPLELGLLWAPRSAPAPAP